MLQSMLEIGERKVSNTQSSESHVGALVARPDPRPQSFARVVAARVAGLQNWSSVATCDSTLTLKLRLNRAQCRC